jgi:hypothetical protein
LWNHFEKKNILEAEQKMSTKLLVFLLVSAGIVVVTVIIVVIAVGGGFTNTPSTTTTVSTTTTSTVPTTTTTTTTSTIKPSPLPPVSQNVQFEIEARDSDFNVHNLIVSTGASVTINFHNEDNGIEHNLAIYTTQDATTFVFRGSAITGPATTTYHFTAPTAPGTFYFRSDTQPEMTGTLVVQ